MVEKTPAFKSIGVRVFILILAVIVPSAGFNFYNASKEKKRWTQEVSLSLGSSTRQASNKLTDLIDSAEELLIGLAATGAVFDNNLFSCTHVLKSVGKKLPKYTNFSVVNADKFIVCSSGHLPKPKDVSKSPNIVEAFETKSFAISPFKFGVLTGKPVLVFSNPILDDDGKVMGTVNNGLSLTWLGEYLSGIAQVAGQRMVVFDGKGTVMASHPADWQDLGSTLVNTPLGKHLFANSAGMSVFTDEDARQVLVSMSQVPRIPGGAYIAATVPLDDVLADTNRDQVLHLSLLGALAVASLLLGWAGVRWMVLEPIDRLTTLAGKVEDGDFAARSGVSYNSGELGALAQAYDRMIANMDANTKALRDSEANYRELVESEEQLIHRFLPDTTEVYVNQAVADFFGGRPEDWIGRRWLDFVSAEEHAAISSLMKACTPEKPTFVYEHMARNSEGENRWLRWNNRAFYSDGGRLTHFQAVAVDLTDRKEVERSLEIAMMEARAASRAKSNFLANMSHELRTPLNSIIGFSEMMSTGVMGELPDTYKDYSAYINSSGHHLLDIINDILDLSKIEAGMLRLDEEPLCVGREIAELVAMLGEQAAQGGNTLVNHADKERMLFLKADRMRIKQVLLNIIGNALKFTQNGHVAIESYVHDGAIIIAVRDTGIGMSENDIEVALSPFGQVDGHHLSKRYEGTGLGLPLAEQLMSMHGGTLGIDSTPGEGTVVMLKFPANRTMDAVET